jgi:hypothetical protein
LQIVFRTLTNVLCSIEADMTIGQIHSAAGFGAFENGVVEVDDSRGDSHYDQNPRQKECQRDDNRAENGKNFSTVFLKQPYNTESQAYQISAEAADN